MAPNQIFYSELSKLREVFHKYGKFDDSNAKLDEIAKYLSIYVYQLQNSNEGISIELLLDQYRDNSSFSLVKKLKEIFIMVANSNTFRLSNGESIFGDKPQLNISDNDNDFARLLLDLVTKSFKSVEHGEKRYDILNECFGHFVRDSFRSHIEDAQYMTPNEVVDLMCDIAFNDIKKVKGSDKFTVLDPCCGVGSFLSSFYHKNYSLNVFEPKDLVVIGQDKVERMVRLSKINMVLANIPNHLVSNDNSLVGKSILDNYTGKVDLILTNPPFGAKFSSKELKTTKLLKEAYPLLHDTIITNGSNFNSEILFVDKCISLLKEGGKMLAVLPDSVISSGGLNSILRHRIVNDPMIEIKAIIELPAVTFAQAGTRTKTSILYLEKKHVPTHKKSVFVAISDKIGFDVSTKKGATVKHETGENDLPEIFRSYQRFCTTPFTQEVTVIQQEPSCVAITADTLEDSSWTPKHYSASKYLALNEIGGKDIEAVKLSNLVNFGTARRKKDRISVESKCISVLHVSDEDLNYEDLLIYTPKYHGTSCKPGDILFSKINPRIMRVLVVPDIDFPLTCSTEFEIMNSKTELSNYAIKLLLMHPSVQAQINSLTSGTSSSHNRIKTNDLMNVIVPLPKKGTSLYDNFVKESMEYEKYTKEYNSLKINMLKLKKGLFSKIS